MDDIEDGERFSAKVEGSIMQLRLPTTVSDDDLLRIGIDNPGYRFEREEDGSLIVSPTSTKGGAKSGEAFAQLYLYAKRVGGKAFDSSTGFAIGPALRRASLEAPCCAAWPNSTTRSICARAGERAKGGYATSGAIYVPASFLARSTCCGKRARGTRAWDA